MKNRKTWLGITLVVIGLGLIIHRSGLLSIGGDQIFWGAIALVGCALLYRGWETGRWGKLFWGTLLAVFGVMQVLELSDVLYLPYHLWFAVLLIATGFALVVRFIKTPRDWHVLIPAAGCLGIGTGMFLVDAGVLSHNRFLDGIWVAGPLALVVFGAALLVKSRTA
jgi:thiamine transporter ThiT